MVIKTDYTDLRPGDLIFVPGRKKPVKIKLLAGDYRIVCVNGDRVISKCVDRVINSLSEAIR